VFAGTKHRLHDLLKRKIRGYLKSGGLIQADCLEFQSSATSSGILNPRFEAAMRRFEIVATTACGVALGGLGWRSNLP
jgi:hypothetical protein